MERPLLDPRKSVATERTGMKRYRAVLDRARLTAPRIDRPTDRPVLFVDHLHDIFGGSHDQWIRRALGIVGPDLSRAGKTLGFARLVNFMNRLAVPVWAVREWIERHGTPEELAVLERNTHYTERQIAAAKRQAQETRRVTRAENAAAHPKVPRESTAWVSAPRAKKGAPPRPIPTSVFDLGSTL
jgi:hypothetical protein